MKIWLVLAALLPCLPVIAQEGFIENNGIMEGQVRFVLKGRDRTLYFTSKGITFDIIDDKKRNIVTVDFVDSDKSVTVEGLNRKPTRISLYNRNGARNLPCYQNLVYENLWQGIDLELEMAAYGIKYQFRLKTGADPKQICMLYSGVESAALLDDGKVVLTTEAGNLEDEKPIAYQAKDGEAVDVQVSFKLDAIAEGAYQVAFNLGAYDASRPLVIDPAFFIYCGFLGGVECDYSESIDVDSAGNAYIAGWTRSFETSFPLKAGPDLTFNGGDLDAFVAKVSNDGDKIIYCGYIGGASNEKALSISVDSSGNAYITGWTESTEYTFPVKAGPDSTYNGNRDAFVAKVNATGSDLEYLTYIGGSGEDSGIGIAVNPSGNAYLLGRTESTESTFPIKTGPDLSHNGKSDLFIAKLSASGGYIDYCGFVGGSDEEGWFGDVEVDCTGRACICGFTASSEVEDFPVKIGPDLTFNGEGGFAFGDGFVAMVNQDGSDLAFCGYIGGKKDEWCADLALDDSGALYVVGSTWSGESTFPVTGCLDPTYNGACDIFVAKIEPDGSNVNFSGYLGGDKGDFGWGIAVDRQGGVYLAGETKSDESSFPVKVGPDLTHNGGYRDGLIAKLDQDGKNIEYCGYIGGAGEEWCIAIALDSRLNAYVTGATESTEAAFPVTSGPDLTHNGQFDLFLAKISQGLGADHYSISAATGGVVELYLCAGDAEEKRDYIVLGSLSGVTPGIALPKGLAVLPLNFDIFTGFIIQHINTPLFFNFMGELDSEGCGTARFDTIGPAPTVMVGLKYYFAFGLSKPWNFTSNYVGIQINP